MNTKLLPPQVGVRVQLAAAALVWLIGGTMVLRLALQFAARVHWLWWVLVAGLVLGVVKAVLVMRPTAARTTARASAHGRDWLLNMYAPRTWLIVGAMIGLGLALRTLGPSHLYVYQIFLAILYLTVALGLLISDLVYWQAFLKTFAPVQNDAQIYPQTDQKTNQ